MNVRRDPHGNLAPVTIRRPSDFHAHFRLPPLLAPVVREGLRHLFYALAMPNNGPITTVDEAVAYHEKIMSIVRSLGYDYLRKVLMTVYFTSKTTPQMIEEIAASDVVCAVKYYPPPKGATTGSGHGVPLMENTEALRAMQEYAVPLLLHGETVYDKHGNELPHAQREGYFYQHEFPWLRESYPELRICAEHISTSVAVEMVKQSDSANTAATITPQHPLLDVSAFEKYSWSNHLKCMPIPKTPEDRAAVLAFMTSGDLRAIAGTDKAPHLSNTKAGRFDECASGCWTPHATGLYALAFEQAGAMDERFEQFMSLNGPAWWGLPPPAEDDLVTIRAVPDGIPEPTEVPEENDIIIPLGWTTQPDRLKLGFGM